MGAVPTEAAFDALKPNGASLSASVAHELNNIAASLFGFVELAAEDSTADSPLLRCLDEIRIGVARVSDLASVLEALSEVNGKSTRVTIRECVDGGFGFVWNCDPSTIVDADPDCVRRAIRTLAHLSSADSKPDSRAVFTVSRSTDPNVCCSYCGAAIPDAGVRITLTVEDFRLFDANAAAQRRGGGKTFRELVAMGSAHITHIAGGHILLDSADTSVSIVLPTAS